MTRIRLKIRIKSAGNKFKTGSKWWSLLPVFIFPLLCGLCLLPPGFAPEHLSLSNQLPGYFSLILTGIILSLLLMAATEDSRRAGFHWLYVRISLIIIAIVLIIAVYSLADYYMGHRAMMTGIFDNPAGLAACICIASPFVLIFGDSIAGRTGSFLILLFLLLTVVLSRSRAGFFSMIVWISVAFGTRIPWKLRTKALLLAAVIVVLFVLAYFLKKDSADGRLLIWQCSWDMIKERPLLGYGHSGFKAHYMDFQANYFVRHPNSPYRMLAGNINHPFNECLLLVIRYGLVGLLLLAAFCFWLFRCFRLSQDKISSRISALSLLSLAVMSMFSYPFSYPFVWIIVLIDCFVLAFNRYSLSCSSKRVRIISISGLVLCFISMLVLIPSMRETVRWQNATKQLRQQGPSALTEMSSLKISRRLPALHLYNYAIILYNACHYEEALEIAEQCREKNADYELDCFLSLLYRKTNHFREAENCCLRASKMCPSRFYPHYLLATLYKSAGMDAEARRVADAALKLPVKVHNPMVDSLQMEMRMLTQ